jgi:hypothetical protein
MPGTRPGMTRLGSVGRDDANAGSLSADIPTISRVPFLNGFAAGKTMLPGGLAN